MDNQPYSIPTPAKSKRLLYIVVSIILIGLIAGIFVLTGRKSGPTLAPAYQYSKLDDYSIKNGGGGLSFKEPEELKVSTSADNRQFEMWRPLTGSTAKPYLTYMAGVYTSANSALGLSNLKILNANFIFPSDKYYPDLVKPLKTFLTDRLSSGWTLTLNKPTQFKNKHIKSDSWLFTYTDTDPSKSHEALSGELIYAIKGKNFYYFTLNSSGNTWTANKNIWQQITDSLQIN